jgi:hypothetical protein
MLAIGLEAGSERLAVLVQLHGPDVRIVPVS